MTTVLSVSGLSAMKGESHKGLGVGQRKVLDRLMGGEKLYVEVSSRRSVTRRGTVSLRATETAFFVVDGKREKVSVAIVKRLYHRSLLRGNGKWPRKDCLDPRCRRIELRVEGAVGKCS